MVSVSFVLEHTKKLHVSPIICVTYFQNDTHWGDRTLGPELIILCLLRSHGQFHNLLKIARF